MNWTAVGAIGELVGGAAVIITLLYLAVQIRLNTKATRAQATAYVASELERTVLSVAENTELAEAFVKAAQGADLSPVERARLLFWWGAYARTSESHVLQAELGTMSDDVREPVAILLRQFSAVPILRESLQQMIDQKVQTKTFRDFVTRNVLK